MRLEFDDESLLEAEEVMAYYSAIAPKIGYSFVLALRRGLARIADNPVLYAPYTDRTRRYVLDGFPYAVVYRVRGEVIRVLAVSHQRRRPGYWRKRG